MLKKLCDWLANSGSTKGILPNEGVDDFVAKLFDGHGVALVSQDGWLTTNGTYPCFRSYVHQPNWISDSRCSIRVDFETALDENRTIIESFGDTGNTQAEALNNSCYNFMTSSFHVLLSGVWGIEDAGHHQTEAWTVGSQRWTVHLGDVVRKARDGASVMPPVELVSAIRSSLQAMELASEPHWIRVYFGNVSPEDPIIEVLLDNETWELGEEQVRALNWPEEEFFYSSRMFLVLIPDGVHS